MASSLKGPRLLVRILSDSTDKLKLKAVPRRGLRTGCTHHQTSSSSCEMMNVRTMMSVRTASSLCNYSYSNLCLPPALLLHQQFICSIHTTSETRSALAKSDQGEGSGKAELISKVCRLITRLKKKKKKKNKTDGAVTKEVNHEFG